jgi:hypothetical protein
MKLPFLTLLLISLSGCNTFLQHEYEPYKPKITQTHIVAVDVEVERM